ncbi:UDP-N-acetylmuramate dehydrogenase [Gammaproteobacteria bacterium]|nr:UDP-N-acetylmuramate dehydrogenase [Gammaproteobacteria bacterium]
MTILEKNCVQNELLASHTSWKIGGRADIFFSPNSRDELSEFLKSNDCSITWLGNGTNILIRDGGVRGAVISTKKSFNNIQLLDRSNCKVEAGVSCFELAMHAVKNNIGPAAFFSGIPGSIGGALTMNAGCFGHETWEFVKSIEVIDRNGEIHHLDPKEFSISYRSVSFPFPLWFLSCDMTFPDKGVTTMEELKSMRNSRIERQPLTENTCGSVFKNPDGNHAGDLIERSGLKGFRIGGCSVSEKHANFIVNDKRATARDIETLINHIQNTVKDRFGIDLDTEVRIIGEYDES